MGENQTQGIASDVLDCPYTLREKLCALITACLASIKGFCFISRGVTVLSAGISLEPDLVV